eukprot:SAG31_NODE_27645_length_422_cov_1.421053_1_plen_72_part_10
MGVRVSSPAGMVLASLCQEESQQNSATLFKAVKAVDGVLPFYAVTAIFCAASALNHSCVPTVEVVSGQRGGE